MCADKARGGEDFVYRGLQGLRRSRWLSRYHYLSRLNIPSITHSEGLGARLSITEGRCTGAYSLRQGSWFRPAEAGGPDPPALILSNARSFNHLAVNNLEMMKVTERQEPGEVLCFLGHLRWKRARSSSLEWVLFLGGFVSFLLERCQRLKRLFEMYSSCIDFIPTDFYFK